MASESYPTNSTIPGPSQVRHIVPAIITAVTCVALILVIVVGLKVCALLRRQRILNFVGRTFSPSESQQQLPVKSTKKCSKELLSCSNKSFQTKVASDDDWDKLSIGSCGDDESDESTLKCMEALCEIASNESSDSNLHQDEVSLSQNYTIINPELLKKELEVEVEVHPSLFQEDSKTKSLLSKIARGSCSQHESEEDLCAGLSDPM